MLVTGGRRAPGPIALPLVPELETPDLPQQYSADHLDGLLLSLQSYPTGFEHRPVPH